MLRLMPILWAFLMAACSPVFGQEKFEREYRIQENEVPDAAVSFVRSLDIPKKVKWYYEENLVDNSVEAKFLYLDHKYSVEFGTTGKLQDIEIEVDFEMLPGSACEKISRQFLEKYLKYKIRKVQIQYSGDIESLSAFAATEDPLESYPIRYELVVKAKTEEKWGMYEITFDDRAKLVDVSRIILRNTDNLEF